MGPLPYPHRATFLATTLAVPAELVAATPHLARLVSVIVFDHLVRHPIVTLGDHDDERLIDDAGRLLDANHPQIEDSFDWFFRASRRHEVLWFEISFDPEVPGTPSLYARRPDGAVEPWGSSPELALSQQLGQCLAQWLSTRRLPQVGPLPDFTLEDVRVAADRLVKAEAQLAGREELTSVSRAMSHFPRLGVPFLRVLADLARDEARSLDPSILRLDPTHPVARRNHYVTSLLAGEVERRAILPVVADAPMYGKPHLSIWGEPFAGERPLENMGVRHQGIAASLMPANPYACHNYSLQLAETGRREESYRWADRATVAAPQFGAAHLDCVRRLRQVGRPGQAFAEAQYRCREILDRHDAGTLTPNDWQAPHHAALLIAFAHLDIGRIAEAIELADDAIARLPDDAPTQESFAWAQKRIAHWKSDAGLLARAYAWEGHHRGDPGRVIAGLLRGRITDDDDAMMLIEALVAIGRPEQAELAYWQCAGLDGPGVLGDGKARLAAAKALILAGELGEALDQIQIVQLRRHQSRLEADVNRLYRLAAIRPAIEWERVVERRLELGAATLARDAARDLADFVPDLDTPLIRRALGERTPLALEPGWTAELVDAVPAAQATAPAIVSRLARPKPGRDPLEAADALAQEWWTVLVPPARDRDAHAAGAVLALGVSLAHYLVLASGPPTPLAGAYRHIATEALHLVRRSRYQIEPGAITALLRVVEGLADAPEWLLDTWLLRIERALDLEAEHGAYLEGMTAGLPTVQRLLRGDERSGWELRLAHDLAQDPSQYEPAATLFTRCARTVEAGVVPLAWSAAAAAAAAPQAAQLDVHWLAAMSNPTGAAAPWLRLGGSLLGAGRRAEGLMAACRGATACTAHDRPAAIAELTPRWRAAGLTTPLDGAAAFEAGLAAAEEDRLDLAVQHLRWALAVEPGNAKRAQSLAVALGRRGHGTEALRVLSQHERTDGPRLIGRVLLDAGRAGDAVRFLRYASRRFRTAEDWASLAGAAGRANDAVAVEAGRRALALGAKEPSLLIALATGLYRMGEFHECERVAQQLIAGGSREAQVAGLHAMARALAGQGRHVDAHPDAQAAADLGPNGELAAELIDTMDRIIAQQSPPIRPSPELSPERRACADLEAGRFDSLVLALAPALASASWGVARVALAACELRTEDENGIPVSPRAIDGALAVLGRTIGATHPDAVLARIRALRIRDNAFIQIDPPPPLGVRYTPEEFERTFAERDRRPRRPSAVLSFAR
jgi:tetratricopeptide (TPR) repeat protein